MSGANGGDQLRRLAGKLENVVFLKAYRNVTDIKAAIDEIGDYPSCVGVKSCGQPDEEIVQDLEELSRCLPDYWTLIIAKQNKKNDLPEG
jgi:precorrin-2/cobalt-factor-2 C20-methyltransferase